MSFWPKVVAVYGAVLATAALVSGACQWDYATTAFRCDPSNPDCPDSGGGPYQCCSDDPAALDLGDLSAFVAPSYAGGGGTGTPLFSGNNNSLGRSGFCVEAVPGLIEEGAAGCPIPCNPTWGSDDLAAVCGAAKCCQTVELEAEDCALDPTLGDSGCYRPVTGTDINGFGGADATNWSGSSHATHQDPNGAGCITFAQGDEAIQGACFRRLSVADQRGFCQNVEVCPLTQPGYIDACSARNAAEGLSGC